MDKNAEGGEIEIVWDYVPPEFFEESFCLEQGDFSIEIGKGRAFTRISEDYYNSHPNLDEMLTKQIKTCFLWAQRYRRKPFRITCRGIIPRSRDGQRRPIVKYVEFALEVTEAEDNSSEIRKARAESMRRGAQSSFAQASDRTARKIMKSYSNSLSHPEDEMGYLYEIWEALKKRFADAPDTLAALGLRDNLERFRDLTCNLELKQSRHRGRFDSLREATPEELNAARGIALEMIEKYLKYLDNLEQRGLG